MLLDLFISLSIPLILFEITCMFNPGKYTRYLKEVKYNLSEGNFLEGDKPFLLFTVAYGLWTIIGLITNYWPLFTSIILLSSLSDVKIGEKWQNILRFVVSSLSLITLCLIFYLHFVG